MQDRSIGKSGDDPAAVGGGQGHETDVRGDKMVWEVVCLAERANGWVRVKGGELWNAGAWRGLWWEDEAVGAGVGGRGGRSKSFSDAHSRLSGFEHVDGAEATRGANLRLA